MSETNAISVGMLFRKLTDSILAFRRDSGSTVPIALMEALVSPGKLGLREQTVVYGMTETSPVTFGCGKSFLEGL